MNKEKQLGATEIYEELSAAIMRVDAETINSIMLELVTAREIKILVTGWRKNYEQKAQLMVELPLKRGADNRFTVAIGRGKLGGGDPWGKTDSWVTFHTLDSTFRLSDFQPDQSLRAFSDDLVKCLHEFFQDHFSPTQTHFGDR